MFKETDVIRSVRSRHSFVCFDLQFIDPLSGGGVKGELIPYSALHMVQRGSGLRSTLYYRIENVTWDRQRHDEGVVKSILQDFFKNLFAAEGPLGDFMPLTGPHDMAAYDATDEALAKIYWQLAVGMWNGVTAQKYTDTVQYNGGGYNTSRLNVYFGNGLGFVMSANPHDIYRGPTKLRGVVNFCGKKHHFGFMHSELGNEDLESLLTPVTAVELLLDAFDKYAPVFRGIEQELRFKD